MDKKKVLTRRRLTPARLAKCIKGSGGVVKRIADRLDCSYHSVANALKKEGTKYDYCRELLKEEKEWVGDMAEETVQDIMRQRLDISTAGTTARWFLDRKHTNRGYKKQQQVTLEGGKNPIRIENHTVLPIDKLDLSLSTRKELLAAMEKYEKDNNESSL